MKRISKFLGFLILILIFFLISMFIREKNQPLILATTTSTYDTGLLDYLLPDFQKEYKDKVQVVPIGTGQAIKNGERGDVDVILVHSPEDEKKFVDEGFGINRTCIMYNDFILLGPKDDPAGVKNKTIENAFKTISEKEFEFISRGDDSGTHKRELSLWSSVGIEPKGDWYKEVGSGMADTIRIANEKLAYTLADRGTYLSLKDKIDLIPLVGGGNGLLNQYSVIAVNPKLRPYVNYMGAMKFISWLMLKETQEKIDSFRKNDIKLFTSLGGRCIGD